MFPQVSLQKRYSTYLFGALQFFWKLVARWLCQLLMTSLKYQLSSPLGLQTAFTGSHFFLFFLKFFWHFLWQNSWPFEVMVVILSVTAYVGAKPVVEKAQKFDAMKKWYVSKVWPSALPQRIGHGSWSRFYRWPAGVYRMNGRKQKKHTNLHMYMIMMWYDLVQGIELSRWRSGLQSMPRSW